MSVSSNSHKKGLGRTFESLIPTDLLDESFDPTAAQDEQISELRQIKLSQVVADPDQPRRQFDQMALEDLAASITTHGILQPIVVTPYKGGYQIVAGERRYRAAKLAGIDKIPALVRTLSGQHKLELSLIENLQRRDLNVLETATAYMKLRDQFNLSLDEIGKRVGNKSAGAVSNILRLLKLPDNVRQAIADGKLSEGQSRPLVGMDRTTIDQVLPQIIREQWSARRVEQFAVNLKKQASETNATSRPPINQPYQVEVARIQKRFGTEVSVRTNSRGAGQLVIRFKSDEDFARIEQLLSE